jgi:hypothetical protein
VQATSTDATRERPNVWTAAALIVATPLVALLCLTLWRMPFPVSEAVAIFEDVARQPAFDFVIPDQSYYRPLFHITISAIWHNAGSLAAALAWIKLLHIVPIVVLAVLFVGHVRPRTPVDAAVAAAAMAIVLGSPGFRDNLEIPLSYTIIGMPLVLAVWMLLTRERRLWHEPIIVVLILVAIGFKEQGLVLVPLVLAMWWTRAPGANGVTAVILTGMAVGYVVVRVMWGEEWAMFEQAVGLGFGEMEPPEAEARYGRFPYFVYAYSGVATIANVLFAEPTRGTFSIVRLILSGHPQPWQLVHLGSSVALTAIIAWWAVGAVRHAKQTGWSPDSRLLVALVVVLLACGALSFNYSRDRLGGMAVPIYALAAFHALRAAVARASAGPRLPFAVVAVTLFLVALGWHVRAVGTLERTRLTSYRNHTEWLVALPQRRIEFAERPVYLRIMHSMIDQGTTADPPQPTRYPRWLSRWIAEL